MRGARNLLLATALLVATGVAIATLRRDRAPAPVPAAAPALALAEAEIAALRQALEEEHFARQVLEEQLAFMLREKGGAAAARRRSLPRVAEVPEAEGGAPAGSAADRAGEAPEGEPGRTPWFDPARLAALGLGPDEIDELRRLWEAHQMNLLEVRDTAAREGYAGTRRHFEEAVQLALAFRADLGDETYDRVLHATGQPNRALVRNVLDRSPASEAGLEPGDVIWHYDGALILSPQELKNATAAGRPGDLVAIEVLRDGEHLRLFVPRGPLGMLLEKTRVSPDAAG